MFGVDGPIGPYYLRNTPIEEIAMVFIKAMQQRDWIIAAVAFVVGAIIF